MSGYNEQAATSRFAGDGLAGFLQKPFSISGLVRALDPDATLSAAGKLE